LTIFGQFVNIDLRKMAKLLKAFVIFVIFVIFVKKFEGSSRFRRVFLLLASL